MALSQPESCTFEVLLQQLDEAVARYEIAERANSIAEASQAISESTLRARGAARAAFEKTETKAVNDEGGQQNQKVGEPTSSTFDSNIDSTTVSIMAKAKNNDDSAITARMNSVEYTDDKMVENPLLPINTSGFTQYGAPPVPVSLTLDYVTGLEATMANALDIVPNPIDPTTDPANAAAKFFDWLSYNKQAQSKEQEPISYARFLAERGANADFAVKEQKDGQADHRVHDLYEGIEFPDVDRILVSFACLSG